MTNLSQQLSKRFFGAAMRVVTLTLFLAVFGASAAQAQTKAYVANENDSFISVIDTSNHQVVSTIPLDLAGGLAVTPDGAFIYVLSRRTGDVHVISTATESLVATVPVGGSDGPIVINPNGAFAYFADSSGTISVISTASKSVTDTISVGSQVFSMAFTPDGAFLYVPTFFTGDLKIIDTSDNSVFATLSYGSGFPFGDGPGAVSITPNGAFAYVSVGNLFNPLSIHISKLSTTDNSEVASIPITAGKIAFTPDGAFGFATNASDNTVLVINTSNDTVVDTVSVPNPGPVAMTPDGAFVYVPNFPGNTVTVIRTADHVVVATVPVGALPQAIGFGGSDPLQSLIAQIQALITAGTLTQNQGAGLIDKINQVIDKLDSGQTSAACNQLNAFIDQVNAFIHNHSLTPSQGQPLIDGANAIRADIGCS